MNAYETLMRIPGATQERLWRLSKRRATDIDKIWARPDVLVEKPDHWQREVLGDPKHDWLLLCSRQSGKTTVTAAKAVWEMLCCQSFVLVLAPSDKQVLEFVKRVRKCLARAPYSEVVKETASELVLANGARLLALPNNEATVRTYSEVDLLIIDEASRVPDTLYAAVTPMLAVSKGRKILLSTPFGQRGFFFNSWTKGTTWRRQRVTWKDCPRITPEFIATERSEHGEFWIRQEYECEFVNTQSSVFDVQLFQQLVSEDVEELYW